MAVTAGVDPARLLEEQADRASLDLPRELLTAFVNTLISAEADTICGAANGTLSEARVNRRNGHRAQKFGTRAGTIELAIPKLHRGTER